MRKERHFLASLAAALVIPPAGSPARAQEIAPRSVSIVQEDHDVENLWQTIEQRFDVTLGVGTIPWDSRRLIMLRNILAILPDHLFKPTAVGRRTQFELRPYFYNQQARCACANPNSTIDRILLNEDSGFNPDFPQRSTEILVHELVHKVTPMDFDDSPWYEAVEQILGGSFAQKRHEVYEKVLQVRPTIREELDQRNTTETEVDELGWFLRMFCYGIGRERHFDRDNSRFDTPYEFIAVLGQHFFLGRNYFLRMYGAIFDEETTRTLYNFTRDEVFKGVEYERLFIPMPNEQLVSLIVPRPTSR